MSNFSGYKTKAFSETQKFFVLDPNTGSPSFVNGADLVKQLTPSQNYVFSESTRTTAEATDYPVGSLIETAGDTSAGDNFAAGYLVVEGGQGDFPMQNGNDLLVIKGDELLREQLASDSASEGSDLVAHTGTDDTVTETLNKNIADINQNIADINQNIAEIAQRTIYVGSVAEGINGLSLADGTEISVTGWHSASEVGGGEFVYRSSIAKSQHNGGTIISPTVPKVSNQTGANLSEKTANFLSGVGETDASGTGAFVRKVDGHTDFSIFGANVSLENNYPGIQASLDYVASIGGGTVYRTDGIYKIQQALEVSDNTTISLPESGVTILRNAAIDNIIRNKSDGVSGGYSANKNITLYGGIWDANRGSFTTACSAIAFGHASGIKCLGGTVTGVPVWHGIEFNAVTDGRIDGWSFTDSDLLDNAEAVQIDLMLSTSQFPWFGPYDSTACEKIIITKCKFDNVGTGIGSHSSDLGFKHAGIIIDNNTFQNIQHKGIKPFNWSGVKITGNRFIDLDFGVSATVPSGDTCSDYVVSGNTFFAITKTAASRAIQINGNNGTDFRIDHVIVSNNFVEDVDNHGIGLDFCNHVTVAGNTVTDCGGSGIWIYGCKSFSVTGNVTRFNNKDGTRFDLYIGEAPSVTDRGAVTGNTASTARIGNVSEVLFRNNVIPGSLTQGSGVNNSSIGGNLVAGTFS